METSREEADKRSDLTPDMKRDKLLDTYTEIVKNYYVLTNITSTGLMKISSARVIDCCCNQGRLCGESSKGQERYDGRM